MSSANWPNCLAFTLQEEGGYVDNPRDPGGVTNLGVTIATLSHYEGHPATPEDVANLTPEQVAPIYHSLYWNVVQCDGLKTGVDLLVFDACVNSGPGRAAKTLQQAAGVTADGIIGPATLAAVNALSAPVLVANFTSAHEAFYRSLSTYDTFGRGWDNRAQAAAAKALDMANG